MSGGTVSVNATDEVDEVARGVLQGLGNAWNAGDGTAFGAPFAADAAFVTIRGVLLHGREAIARGHQAILETIYRGSTVAFTLLQARVLTEGAILAHARGELAAPAGPLAGEHAATATLVLVRPAGEADWRVAAFHNTLVAPPR